MTTEQGCRRTMLFARVRKRLLFWKCIINQKQCRTIVKGGVLSWKWVHNIT